MKLPRLKFLDERLFAQPRFPNGDIDTSIRDLTKILLLGDSPLVSSWTIDHWLSLVIEPFKDINKFKVPISYNFLGFGLLRAIQKAKAVNYYREFRVSTPKEYFSRILEELYSQKKEGSLKYDAILSSKSPEEINYVLQQIMYIALRLTGQFTSGNQPWDVDLLRFPGIDFTLPTPIDGVEDRAEIGNFLVSLLKDAVCGSSISTKFKTY